MTFQVIEKVSDDVDQNDFVIIIIIIVIITIIIIIIIIICSTNECVARGY